LLEKTIISPYLPKPTHHLIYDKYAKLEQSTNIAELLKEPVVLFGNSLYVYDGHHRIMLARNKKLDIAAYIVQSQRDFLELPKRLLDIELNPDKHSYDVVLKILEDSSLADDEVFN
jgi:hypothetical protein